MGVEHTVLEEPIKFEVDESREPVVTLSPEELGQQAEDCKKSMVEVDSSVPGTCIDERCRKSLLSEKACTSRPSTPGGPDVYGSYVAELVNFFTNGDESENEHQTDIDRLTHVKQVINQAGISSGGHEDCAANAKFKNVLELINDGVKGYASLMLGDDYDESIMDEVIGNAALALEAYESHEESALANVLGDEKQDAIEILEGEHEGRTIVRNFVTNRTVDQTALHNIRGEDSFVMDDWYAEEIELAICKQFKETDREHIQKLARHGREAVLAAISQAVPNKELHQIMLSSV